MASALNTNGAALAAISGNSAAFASLANNKAALSALAQNGPALAALSNSAAFRSLSGNAAFTSALQSGSFASAMQGGFARGPLVGVWGVNEGNGAAAAGGIGYCRGLASWKLFGGSGAASAGAATASKDTTTVVEPSRSPTRLRPPPKEDVKPQGPAHVPPDASGIDLTTLETKDLDLLYFDPLQTYLTPYIARAFENALQFHKRKFQWTPWEPTTMLLKDFSDYANAGARASPNNAVLIDVAPLSVTMETFSPGERFFTIVNHEMAHVAQMDVWNKKDAFWRHFFHGKVPPVQEHPESIIYNFLVTPRNNTPRWYLEGGAVFFETWMSGGLGRAQGGYDEMALRAKVRDNDKFYSPLGLESEGIAVDFQVGVNDYLYGTRFMSYLALKYGPEKVVEWQSRARGQQALLRRAVQARVRPPARRRVERLDRLRA